MNILEEVQQYVADKLNADSQLSACPFLVENRRDIDFQIKQALGKQGVVGLVMTPKATYAGAYMDVGIAWQIDELEIDVVENVTVNRGKRDGYITGQDAAMRLFEVLCPLSGEHEGQFNPVSYSEGEDNSLLVNKSVLKCLVHKLPDLEMRTKVTYADGSSLMVEVEGVLSSSSIPSINDVVEVEIGNAVTSIGDNAFDRCAELETVVIPESVETIGTMGFSRTRRLTSITIKGNGLKVIGPGAFVAATALTSISLPNSVVSIGRSAFEDCVQLTSIVIPASVRSMDREVFLGCSELMNVTFSDKDKATVKGMENYSWALQDGCVIHCMDGNIVVGSETKVTYQNGDVVEYDINGELTRGQISSLTSIVSVEIGNSVTSLATNAFYSCTNLSSVTIPDSVSSIGDSAFKNCYKLTSISLPDTVQSIAEDAFAEDPNIEVTFQGRTKAEVQAMENYPWGIENTQNIRSIIGPNTRVKYGWSQSWDSLPLSGTLNSDDLPSRDGIRYVGIGSSIDEIGYKAFSGIEFLTGVEIPTTVTAIGAWAFSGAEGMTDIEIPSSVSSIGSDAFFGCHILSSVMFEGKTLEQVQAMENYSWALPSGCVIHCTDGDITIQPTSPNTKVKYTAASGLSDWEGDIVGTLTDGSIPNKSNIAEVEIGSHVTYIGDYAFNGCSSLTRVTIPDSVTTIRYQAFQGCRGLASVTIPNSVTYIGDYVFSGCSSLTSVTIPDSVRSIGQRAFDGCRGLTSVTIPDSVTSIGGYAFNYCSRLTNVTFSGKDKAIVQGMSNYSWGLRTGCVIHCTDGDITI